MRIIGVGKKFKVKERLRKQEYMVIQQLVVIFMSL